MAGSTRAELPSSGLDGSNFTSSYSSGQRGTYSGTVALDRSGSFREGLENRMMVPGPMASRNAAPSVGMPSISQYLGLDTFSMAELKNVRSGELRRVLGVSVEDQSFGSLQSKSLPPISWEELKRYRGVVEETSSRARDRAKLLQDSLQKLDKYRNVVSKKRQRSDLQSSDKIGSSNMLKMGSHMHQNSSELAGQKLDERLKNGLPNKRVRSSMAEVRASSPYSLQSEGRSSLPVRQGPMVDKDKSILTDKDKSMLRACNGVPVTIDDKMRVLPGGGDGWDKKMKRKRSVGTMVNKSADGDRELKQALQQRPNNESRPRSSDGLGFRTGSSNGIFGSNKMDGTSQLSGGSSRVMPRSDLGNSSLLNDRREYSAGLDKERVTAKGSTKVNICEDAQLGTQSPSTKRKASRAPRTGSSAVMNTTGISRSSGGIDGWEQSSGLNKVQPLSGAVNHKRPLPTGSSSPPVTKWGGQRPQKISRTRRANVVSPVSNFDEAQSVSEGFVVAPDVGTRLSSMEPSGGLISRGIVNNTHLKMKLENVSSPAGLSETEESAALENKAKEKGIDDCEIADVTHNSTHKTTSFVLPMKKNKAPLREEIGDGVRRQGRSGRGSIQSRACLQLSKDKSENIENIKPLKSGRLISDKTENKIGRPPKKCSDRRVSRTMQIISPSDLTGESDDDREELLATAKAVRDGCNLSDFWKIMEPFFSPVSSDDVALVKHQIGFADELDGSFTNTLSTDCSAMGEDKYNTVPSHISQQVSENNVVELNNSAGAMYSVDDTQSVMTTTGKMERKRLVEKSVPLSQRLLAAFIVEDGTDMFDSSTEQGDAFSQFSSDCSPYGVNGSVENEHGCDVTKYGIELDNDLGSQTNCHADITFCNGFASPSTFRSPSTFISADIMREDDDNPDSTTLSELGQAKSSQQESMSTYLTDASYKCQYEQMSLDDKILMELNSIGIYPEPDLSEEDDDEIDKAIAELKSRLYGQLRKKKSQLCKLEKAIQEKQELEKRNLEHLAMDKLVEKAYFKLLGGRGHGSSHRSGSKVSKQHAMAFAKRTLARYRKFVETGQSCFSDPILRDVLFSEPIKEGEPKRPDAISSGFVQNMYIEPHLCQPGLRTSAAGVPSNLTERHGPGLNIDGCETDLYPGIIDPISNRGKKREVLLDDVAGAASRAAQSVNSILPGCPKWKKTDKDHNRDILAKSSAPKGGRTLLTSGRGERKSKVKPTKQKIAQLSTSGNGLGRVTETTNFMQRESGETVNTGSIKTSQDFELANLRNNSQDFSKEIEDSVFPNLPLQGIDSIDELDVADGLGGQGQDIGSWLNVDEDALLDNDLVGLEIPMDDLSDLKLQF